MIITSKWKELQKLTEKKNALCHSSDNIFGTSIPFLFHMHICHLYVFWIREFHGKEFSWEYRGTRRFKWGPEFARSGCIPVYEITFTRWIKLKHQINILLTKIWQISVLRISYSKFISKCFIKLSNPQHYLAIFQK